MPWIKRWRDWAMNELWSLHKGGPQPQALHYRYEKAGLILENQPIPWNADAVLVEGRVHLPAGQDRHKGDFRLRLSRSRDFLDPELMQRDENDGSYRLLFQLQVPAETTTAELLWRGRSLAQMTLPVLSEKDFRQQLGLHMSSLHVQLGERTVACRTYVSTQCNGLAATAILSSPTSLAPLADLELCVEFRSDKGNTMQRLAARLSSSQLQSKQALVTVLPRKPRRLGGWQATWFLGDVPLASQRIKGITARQFQQSLHICDTRFVIQDRKGQVRLSRLLPPLNEVARVGPCFWLSSSQPGMAGLCTLQVRARVTGASQTPLLLEEAVLISDGPATLAPGTLAVDDLDLVSGFELRSRGQTLGLLPLTSLPAAAFSSEGSFKPAADFLWCPAADQELNARLGRLLGIEHKL